MATIELRGGSKTYPGGVAALATLDLAIGDGERFVVVGPSGSGKSTLLRLVAGLETLTTGTLWIDGRRADDLPPHARDLAMVFQHPALYPHLSVFENLAFGLRARGRARPVIAEEVARIAARLGLGDLLGRWPRTLSGGQRQRVALGRALVRRPRAFLLDEPFSSLDAPLRAGLRAALLDLHHAAPTTLIYVTHDQAEALALGDRIAVMNQGRIIQTGTPLDVYDRPANRFVAAFLGSPPMNLLPCLVERMGAMLQVLPVGTAPADAWMVPDSAPWIATLNRRPSGRYDLGFRPERVRPGAQPRAGELSARAEVRRLEPLGHESIATMALGPHALRMRCATATPVRGGAPVAIVVDPAGAVWFDPETGDALS